ncbi:RNA polymerase sigma factor (TIGR02999 family) [Tahibacter aquaticus]|uniref:RNA polymerase sigma factor (TIGR02999 family) n=1 Tax=Tahibacter aquaticus TaxID=520092 RepID=A0A4R6YWM7_9GAMM|nr:ECF-type sigma factor [Tahibacter aquaticus]TDR43042.1 RNA polymerase sigma factor (TIGR02999 family) [Tahibacter aquaticus]
MNDNTTATDITALLAQWRDGDATARENLAEAVYPVLHDIAHARLRASRNHLTLSATELANETYARLSQHNAIEYRDRGHFFAAAARATRHFVIDYVRSRDSDKRGGGLRFVGLDQAGEEAGDDRIDLQVDWLAVHAALDALERIDAACAQVVELKFFSGMTTDEIAAASGISRASVVRHWRFAKVWLADRLRPLA